MPSGRVLKLIIHLVKIVPMTTNGRSIEGDRRRKKELMIPTVRRPLQWRLLAPEENRRVDFLQVHSFSLAMVAESTRHAKFGVERDNGHLAPLTRMFTGMVLKEPQIEIRQYLERIRN